MPTARFTWQPIDGRAVTVTVDPDGSVRNYDDAMNTGPIIGCVFKAPRGGWAWSRSGVIETRTGCATRDVAVSSLLRALRTEGKV